MEQTNSTKSIFSNHQFLPKCPINITASWNHGYVYSKQTGYYQHYILVPAYINFVLFILILTVFHGCYLFCVPLSPACVVTRYICVFHFTSVLLCVVTRYICVFHFTSVLLLGLKQPLLYIFVYFSIDEDRSTVMCVSVSLLQCFAE